MPPAAVATSETRYCSGGNGGAEGTARMCLVNFVAMPKRDERPANEKKDYMSERVVERERERKKE